MRRNSRLSKLTHQPSTRSDISAEDIELVKQSFDQLSPEERKEVGDPEDYDWEHPLTNEALDDRPDKRVDPDLHEPAAGR